MGEFSGNPILTQRSGLDPARRRHRHQHGTCRLGSGSAWRLVGCVLGLPPYEDDFYNTGRDTYLLPVTWKHGWPTILEKGKSVANGCQQRKSRSDDSQ